MKRNNLVLLFTVILLISGSRLSGQLFSENGFKFSRTLSLLDAVYVDSVNLDKLTETAIADMLHSLDPHSSYIPAKDVQDMNEPLNGNFEGIGIQFNILHDTIIVIEPIVNGPSERVGLKAGDRIVTIDNENVAGIQISTSGVRSRLMGPKGTKVDVGVTRKGVKDLYNFTITRDKIPINSLDAAYMINNETAYFKFNKFALTTEKEFFDGLTSLDASNLRNVIIDVRGNPGGVMLAAVAIANQFFDSQKLIVYMEGRKTPRQDFKSNGKGALTKTRLVIITDEGSASASEILAGAVQDWDRGLIIGRRTFGKGLVQNAFTLTDGSQVRLTVARYYTPTSRSIQSPYKEGYTKYMDDYYNRFRNGETLHADSIRLPDSLRFKTLVNRRTVFGGGGIMPDIFVAADTSDYTDYYGNLIRRGVFTSFTLEYSDQNRDRIKGLYRTFDDYKSGFDFTDTDIKQFIKAGEDAGVKFNEAQFAISEKETRKYLKALVANNIWNTTEYFRIINEDDVVIAKTLGVLADRNKFDTLLGTGNK